MKRDKPDPSMPDWAVNLRSNVLKFGFDLHLSRSMLEFLCAVADDTYWDRTLTQGGIHEPDNWIATGFALTRRGLIVRKPPLLRSEPMRECHWSLTPAGELVVSLVKMAGIFVEACTAAAKRVEK